MLSPEFKFIKFFTARLQTSLAYLQDSLIEGVLPTKTVSLIEYPTTRTLFFVFGFVDTITWTYNIGPFNSLRHSTQ